MRRTFFAVVVTFLMWSGGRRLAQGQTNTTGLTGSWLATFNLPQALADAVNGGQTTAPILFIYNSNGTMTEVLQGGGDTVGAGAWSSAANGQFAQTAVHFLSDNNGNFTGTIKIRESITVTGNQMSGTAELLFLDPSGAVQGDFTGLTFTANQIAVEQIGAP